MILVKFRNCAPNLATCTRDVLHSNRLHISNFLHLVLILGEQSEGRLQVFLSHNNNLRFIDQGYIIHGYT